MNNDDDDDDAQRQLAWVKKKCLCVCESEREGEQEMKGKKDEESGEEKTGQLPFQSTVSKRLLSPLYAGTFKARREKRNCCYYSNYW